MKFIRDNSANFTKEEIAALDFDWGYVHMLTDKPMTLDEVLAEVANYNEAYSEMEGQFNADPHYVAYNLIRLVEVGMARTEQYLHDALVAALKDEVRSDMSKVGVPESATHAVIQVEVRFTDGTPLEEDSEYLGAAQWLGATFCEISELQ